MLIDMTIVDKQVIKAAASMFQGTIHYIVDTLTVAPMLVQLHVQYQVQPSNMLPPVDLKNQDQIRITPPSTPPPFPGFTPGGLRQISPLKIFIGNFCESWLEWSQRLNTP